MLCDNCRTTLPDDAVACWKCGRQFASVPAPRQSSRLDVMIALVTFPIAAALFACLGWSIPFTAWGLIASAANQSPQWSGVLNLVGGIVFVALTVGLIGGAWWGVYSLVMRVNEGSGRR